MKRILITLIALSTLLPATRAEQQGKKGPTKDVKAADITAAAWRANLMRKPEEVLRQTGLCIKLFEAEAVKMQKALKAPVPTGGNHGINRKAVQAQWALNEVGTCLFLQGKAYEKLENPDLALKSYRKLVNSFSYAQCWDTGGWFWKPAKAAQKRITALEAKQ